MNETRPVATIRSDLVWVQSATETYYPNTPAERDISACRIARMTLTQDELLLDPPAIPTGHILRTITTLLSAPGLSVRQRATPQRRPPLRRAVRFRLDEITSLHKWQPEFSMSPMFQVGSRGWFWQLVNEAPPLYMAADIGAMREQFDAIEAAWEAARARAASQS